MNRANALALLGLADQPNADMATIKAAYRKKALLYHPDRNPGNAPAEAMFKKINEAHAFLKAEANGASPSASSHGGTASDPGYVGVPVDDEQLEVLGKICDLMKLERCGDSYSYVLQFSTQMMSRLMPLMNSRLTDIAIGTKRKGYKGLNLRMYVLAHAMHPRAGRHRIRAPESVVQHMGMTLGHIDPRLVDRNLVLCTTASVIAPIYQILKAELEEGQEVCLDRLFFQQKFDEPMCISFWKALNPGRSTEDAKRALDYDRNRGFFRRVFR